MLPTAVVAGDMPVGKLPMGEGGGVGGIEGDGGTDPPSEAAKAAVEPLGEMGGVPVSERFWRITLYK